MWQRFTLYDLRVVGHYLGTLILFFGVLMLVPFGTALVFQEWEPAARYLVSVGIALIAGCALRFLRIEPARLSRRQALTVTGFAWVVLALIASIPLYFSGHYLTYLDAVFDGVSGLTTTGASVVVDLDHLSYADNMFRFAMHLLGGLGLIVVALSFGLFGRGGGASLFSSEGRSEHVVPNVVQTTQFIARITLIMVSVATVIIMGLCLVLGMEPARAFLNALWVSVSGFVTGGFAPMQLSIMYYHSFPLECILMVLMILGSISFVLYAEVGKGNVSAFFKDLETKTMVLWLGVMAFVFTATLAGWEQFNDMLAILRRGLFTIVSVFTTTGFQVITTNQITTAFSNGAFLTLAFIMAVGGSSGSTAGGIKFSRMGIIFKSIVANVKETLAPDSARVVVSYNHLGRRVLTPDIVKEAMTVFILYVITYVVGALVGIAHDGEAIPAIFESVAMTSNGGITTSLAQPGMPITLELFYILQMWAGRLEFMTLFALIVEIGASFIPRSKGRLRS